MSKVRPIERHGRSRRQNAAVDVQVALLGMQSKAWQKRVAALNSLRTVPVALDTHILNIMATDQHLSPLRSHAVRVAAANAIRRAIADPKRTAYDKGKFVKPLIDALAAAVYSEDHQFADSVRAALVPLKTDFITPDIAEDHLRPEIVNMLDHSTPFVALRGLEIVRDLWGVAADEIVISSMLSLEKGPGIIGDLSRQILRDKGYRA